jgi:hypothetical protein
MPITPQAHAAIREKRIRDRELRNSLWEDRSGLTYIPLSQDFIAVIDSCYRDKASGFSWHVKKCPTKGLVYAVTIVKDKEIFLHNLLFHSPDGSRVDHKDGDGLNCISSNIRYATNAQNSFNRRHRINSRAPYKGITQRGNKWIAQIMKHGKKKHIGMFADPKSAAIAYNEEAKLLFGEFACINSVDGESIARKIICNE